MCYHLLHVLIRNSRTEYHVDGFDRSPNCYSLDPVVSFARPMSDDDGGVSPLFQTVNVSNV